LISDIEGYGNETDLTDS